MIIAIQKNGKLTDSSLKLLEAKGILRDNTKADLIVTCNKGKNKILNLRDDDIPKLVAAGYADVGIVGENVLLESGEDLPFVEKLNFGKCRLVIAVPYNSGITSLQDLNGLRIATSYKRLIKQFLERNNIKAEIVYMSGSVEASVSLGMADAVCDIVATGRTLKNYKLREFCSVIDSYALLISCNRKYINKLSTRIF